MAHVPESLPDPQSLRTKHKPSQARHFATLDSTDAPRFLQVNLLPGKLAHFTLESVHIEHARQRSWLYWILIATIAIGGICLPLVKVPRSVRATGLIRPEIERSQLQLPEAGYIAKVFVGDNDNVRKGEPILALQTNALTERLSHNRILQSHQRAVIADLRHLINEMLERTPSLDEKEHRIIFETDALKQEYREVLSQIRSNELIEERAKIEYERNELLFSKGLVTARELAGTRFELLRAQSERQSLIEKTLTRWQSRKDAEDKLIRDLILEEVRLKEQVDQCTLIAPTDGALVGFSGWTPGVYLPANQPVGYISPTTTLFLDTLVASTDIGQVRIGQNAIIQVDSFPYIQWGYLSGIVTSISDDIIPPIEGASSTPKPSYKVSIKLSGYRLTLSSGVSGTLRKGMIAHANLVGEDQSLWALLIGRASALVDPQNQFAK